MGSELVQEIFGVDSNYIIPRRLSSAIDWQPHIPFAFWLAEKLAPRMFVELGVFRGDSYSAFCQSLQRYAIPSQVYGVDTWTGDEHTGPYDASVYQELWAFNELHYASFSRLVRMTFDDALPMFDERSIDLLHIDGLHTLEAVTHDFEAWLPKMSTRGVILFHDTHVYAENYGVWMLWRKLSTRYPSFEFPHGNGLGILAVGKEVPEPIRILVDATAEDAARIQKYYAALGERVCSIARIEYWQQKLKETYDSYKRCEGNLEFAAKNNEMLSKSIHDPHGSHLVRLKEEWNRQFTELATTISNSDAELKAQLGEAFEGFLSQVGERWGEALEKIEAEQNKTGPDADG